LSPLRRLLALLPLLALLLAGCAHVVDGEQDQICRRALPAVIETRGSVRLLARIQSDPQQVTLYFSLDKPDEAHRLICDFAASGVSLAKRDLTGVEIDGYALSPSALHFLREGWLHSQASVTAAPRPERGLVLANLTPPVAYGLQQTLSALPRMGIYALIAAAFSLLYGLTGRINLAFGAFVALGGITAVLAMRAIDALGLSSLPVLLAGGAFAASTTAGLFGTATARLMIAPLSRRPGQHVLVASAGLMLVLEEFLRLSQGARTLWLAPVLNLPFLVAAAPGFDVTITPVALAVSITALGMALTLLVMLRSARFGLFWRAASDDAGAAELFGVGRDALVAETFSLAASVAGFAGFLVALHYGGIGFAGGTSLGLTALVAAILGGIGSIGGALVGGALVGLVEAAWSSLMPMVYTDGVVFLLLAVLLALRPGGLLSGRQPGPMRV